MRHMGFIAFDRRRLSGRICTSLENALGAAALVSSLLFGVWMLQAGPAAVPEAGKAPAGASPGKIVANPFGALLTDFQRRSHVATQASRDESVSLKPALEPMEPTAAGEPVDRKLTSSSISQSVTNAPVPPRRPAELRLSAIQTAPQAALRRPVAANTTSAVAPAVSDNRSLIEKMFDQRPASGPQASGPALAYAVPEGGVTGIARSVISGGQSGYNRRTAIYDISAHTVYLPNGATAGGAFGSRRRDRTIRASCMKECAGRRHQMFTSLLRANSFFMGFKRCVSNPSARAIFSDAPDFWRILICSCANGASNGCVSFKNYDAFLQAYQNGEIKHLAVVAHLD